VVLCHDVLSSFPIFDFETIWKGRGTSRMGSPLLARSAQLVYQTVGNATGLDGPR
jgi:hypothetical protein